MYVCIYICIERETQREREREREKRERERETYMQIWMYCTVCILRPSLAPSRTTIKGVRELLLLLLLESLQPCLFNLLKLAQLQSILLEARTGTDQVSRLTAKLP